MAKQVGPIFFTGTIDGLIFYKLGDNYYMRSKGSYKSARHMRRNPRYQRTLQQADRFGQASQLLQEVYYRQLPKAVRKHGLYGKLTGMINSWLYQGKSKEEVKVLLIAHCQKLAAAVTPTAASPAEKASMPLNNKQWTTANAQPSTTTQQRLPGHRGKHSRSRWNVKRNGRLHIPRTINQSLAARRNMYVQPASTHQQQELCNSSYSLSANSG